MGVLGGGVQSTDCTPNALTVSHIPLAVVPGHFLLLLQLQIAPPGDGDGAGDGAGGGDGPGSGSVG